MINIIHDAIVIFLLLGGVFFYIVGAIGLIRMPDVFCRMHATTKCDTLGAGMIFLGLIVWQGFGFVSLNIAIILLFIWLTTPTAAHAIAKSEYQRCHLNTSEEE